MSVAPELLAAVRRLQNEIIAEAEPDVRKRLLAGRPRESAEWPDDLLPLTPELAAWFSWEAEGSWRSAREAGDVYRALAKDTNHRPSLVPVLWGAYSPRQYLIDTSDGSVWSWKSDALPADDTGHDSDVELDPVFVCTFEREPYASFTELLASVADTYAQRRQSPWRRLRLGSMGTLPARIEHPPELGAWSNARVGTVMLVEVHRSPRAFLKYAPGSWVELVLERGASIERADISVELWLDGVRRLLASGIDSDKTLHDDASACASFTRRSARRGSGQLVMATIDISIAEQPALATLIAALDTSLARVAPTIRGSLEPPAEENALRALEELIGTRLPDALRALWSFADGQEGASLYYNLKLLSVADSMSTWIEMRRLATGDLGDAYWDRGLVPVLSRGNGDHLCVDVTGAYGPPGGVCELDHEVPEKRTILSGSVAEWLESFVLCLQYGEYVVNDGSLYPKDFLATGDTTTVERYDIRVTNGRFPWTRTVALNAQP